MNAIEINGVSKSYGAVNALDGITLSVHEAEMFGLIGPDGAGKTTLFRILATLLGPDTGTATVAGLDVVRHYRSIRNIVGYMPGKFSLYPDLSVAENLDFFAAMFGVQPLTIRRHIQMNKLNIKFPVGHSMSTAQKDAWDELLHGKTSDEDAEVEVEDVPATKLDEAASKQSMDMKRFSLCFNGRIDVNMIANSLLHILGDNAVGEVEIVCNLG